MKIKLLLMCIVLMLVGGAFVSVPQKVDAQLTLTPAQTQELIQSLITQLNSLQALLNKLIAEQGVVTAVSSVEQDGHVLAKKNEITLLSPNSGETFSEGDVVTIKWKTSRHISTGEKFMIDLVDGPSGLEKNIAWQINVGSSGIDGTSSYQWKIPKDLYHTSTKFKIKISNVFESAVYNWDKSDNFFTINIAPLTYRDIIPDDVIGDAKHNGNLDIVRGTKKIQEISNFFLGSVSKDVVSIMSKEYNVSKSKYDEKEIRVYFFEFNNDDFNVDSMVPFSSNPNDTLGLIKKIINIDNQKISVYYRDYINYKGLPSVYLWNYHNYVVFIWADADASVANENALEEIAKNIISKY